METLEKKPTENQDNGRSLHPMLGSVISTTCEVTEKTYHLKIEYNGDEYFFIVQTLDCHFRNDINKPIITSIRRGCTYWDCGKRLKKSEKNKIKRTIEYSFN